MHVIQAKPGIVVYHLPSQQYARVSHLVQGDAEWRTYIVIQASNGKVWLPADCRPLNEIEKDGPDKEVILPDLLDEERII